MNKRIKFARLEKKLSQSQLAQLLAVSRSAVGQWESVEGTLPNVAHLIQISKVLSVDFKWLAIGESKILHKKQTIPTLPIEPIISAQEEKILTLIRNMPAGKRRALLIFLSYD